MSSKAALRPVIDAADLPVTRARLLRAIGP
jgi:hypothetical protein